MSNLKMEDPMEKLTLNTFISAATDIELSQYLVLANLKNYLSQFHKNKLYPQFGELIELNQNLNTLKNKRDDFSNGMRGQLIRSDPNNKNIVHQTNELDSQDVNNVFEFIEWALPKIKDGLDEGKAIYDFVEENIKIEEIGILPLYKDEGYFLIPDLNKNAFQIFRFELSIITSSTIPLRSLKTYFVDTIESELNDVAVDNVKLKLIKKYPQLPNPATYNIVINIDFPFDETVLPIAKRKLLRKIAA